MSFAVRYESLKPTGLATEMAFPVQDTSIFKDKFICLDLSFISFVDPVECFSSGSSFPADSAKPVPLAVVSLDSR